MSKRIKYSLLIFFFVKIFSVFFYNNISAQNEFVSIKEGWFYFEGETKKFIGLNAYYLQSEAARGRRYIIDETLDAARDMGAIVVRTWAFYESGDDNNAAIRYSPSSYNENGLKALDYVVFKAAEKNIKLILTLANNFNDFGGIAQYIRWANEYIPIENYSYAKIDFFINESIKNWYKEYIYILLNRTNYYTGVKYKDEPAIFAFELINEANARGFNSDIIYNWYSEMSDYFRAVNQNHLLTTGEIGFDDNSISYSDVNMFYNGRGFLFNGYEGTSYYKNCSIKDIDFASFHLYPSGWGFSNRAGITWIKDHYKIASNFGKLSLLGECGVKNNKEQIYEEWFSEIAKLKGLSILVWQYLHNDVINNDGYGFSNEDEGIVSLIKEYNNIYAENNFQEIIPAKTALYQNFPNPFNPVTKIIYDLDEDGEIILELFNILGERVAILDKGYKTKGVHEALLSFNGNYLSSGVYIYRLKTRSSSFERKMLLLK